ncbi:MAG TPA: S8 family serine peptidase [Candidatus Krumholzibacteria bacterium]|nr:S8 family serine peptidase [Candidatus Krumholzibacteria bacterium]
MTRVQKTLRIALLFAVLCLPAAASVGADREAWPYLPSAETGTAAWRAAHPEWDGRGVVIAVLDTGVDGLAPGLLRTSTGDPKLIAARDFTPEGEAETAEAELDGAALVHPDGARLEGWDALPVGPDVTDLARRPVYMGLIDEPGFRNSVPDVNDDGDTTDRFAFLVFQADRAAADAALGEGRGLALLAALNGTAAAAVDRERAAPRIWLTVVDTDGDGRLDDETVLRDFHVNHDLFTLRNPENEDGRTLMAWSVTVREESDRTGAPLPPTAEFHHDTGSHGSHCAGIAAGFEVSGQAGMHGGAPGAWVISGKLGDNRLSGGATRTDSMLDAARWAADFGERYGLPVVVNMSFGINSVEEEEDTIGKELDALLAEHPDLYFCTSNGNEGPGLSTSGIPATSQSVIASGAYLSPATGADLYNAHLPAATLFAFSSRGGEAMKPDVVSPGSALSSVPGHVDGSARFNGTSMASPQTAGAIACLLSAARAEGLTVHWGMIKRALVAGATPVPGLQLFEQGGGLVDVEGSWAVLRELARSDSARKVLNWSVSAPCPFQADGKAPAAYWRVPGWFPSDPETVTFEVRPVFHPDLTADERDVFFRSFKLRSEAPWLRVLADKRYVRGDMAMTVDVTYDAARLRAPGVYSARVHGSLDGGDLSGLAAREFSLWNTVVVSAPADRDGGYAFVGKDLQPSTVQRHYVEVPAGATALRCRLEVSKDTGARDGAGCTLEICDPEGAVQGGFGGYARPESRPVVDMTVTPPELRPGIWEMNVVAAIGNLRPTDYRLSVTCDAYDVRPAAITGLPRKAGKAAEATLEITRGLRGVLHGRAEAVLDGFTRDRTVDVKDTDRWTQRFTLDAQAPRVTFSLSMDEATANLFTDCAVNILDADGTAVDASGFNGLTCEVGAALPDGADSASYTLQVVGGFARAADADAWSFDLTETRRWAAPVRGAVKGPGSRGLLLHAGVPAALDVSFADAWPAAPDGMSVSGRVRVLDERPTDRRPGDQGGRLVLEVPITLGD